jgi:hypothetical protein
MEESLITKMASGVNTCDYLIVKPAMCRENLVVLREIFEKYLQTVLPIFYIHGNMSTSGIGRVGTFLSFLLRQLEEFYGQCGL